MAVHAWNTDALVVELANRSVSPDDQVYYLIYGWVLATIAGMRRSPPQMLETLGGESTKQ